jgi:hypothetical protein
MLKIAIIDQVLADGELNSNFDAPLGISGGVECSMV